MGLGTGGIFNSPDVLLEMESDSPVLVVAFGGLLGRLGGLGAFEFMRMLPAFETRRAFVRDAHRLWYQDGVEGVGHDVDAVVGGLRELARTAEAERIVFVGASAGGYAAILFGSLLPAHEVLALAPQTLIDPSRLAELGDRRWPERRALLASRLDPRYVDLRPVLESMPSKGDGPNVRLHYAAEEELDEIHAKHLAGSPAVELRSHRLGASHPGGHNLAKVLRDRGVLEGIVSEALFPAAGTARGLPSGSGAAGRAPEPRRDCMTTPPPQDPPLRSVAFLLQMRERHGDVFPIRLVGDRPLLVVGDPDLAKQVFHAPADILRAGKGNRRVLGWLLGEHSLILLDGQRHIDHRRLLLPPLHGEHLARHAETVRALVEARLDAWPLGEETPALPRMRELTLEAIARILVGGSDEAQFDALLQAILALRVPASPRDPALEEFRRSMDGLEALVGEEVARRRRDRGAPGDDVLSFLLAARLPDGSSLSDAEIRGELMTLVVTGGATTAASVSWALERLARAPEALARVAEDAIDGDGRYVDAAICETLRMRPVVPMSARFVERPFGLGERTIPPGTTLAVSALLIHHRADIYPEPAAFRPERFLRRQPDTYAWIPFGGGVRRCIGSSFALLEMRIVLGALLSRMTVRTLDPAREETRNRANTIVPAHGARVVLDSR